MKPLTKSALQYIQSQREIQVIEIVNVCFVIRNIVLKSRLIHKFRRNKNIIVCFLCLGLALLWLFLPLILQRHLTPFFKTHFNRSSPSTNIYKEENPQNKYVLTFNLTNLHLMNIPSIGELRSKWIDKKLERISRRMDKLLMRKFLDVKEMDLPNQLVHVFYYGWFRNLKEDGYWSHWQIKHNQKLPPDFIHSNYYPKLGCYSSKNLTIIEVHMRMLKKAGIGVIILSWVPTALPDSPKMIMKNLLDLASRHKLKVALHIENYKKRNIINVLNNIKLFISTFGNHSAVYKVTKNSRPLPLFYIHETFKIPHTLWKSLLSSLSNRTLRDSEYDGVFLAHLSEQHQATLLNSAQFDGYPYIHFQAIQAYYTCKQSDMAMKGAVA